MQPLVDPPTQAQDGGAQKPGGDVAGTRRYHDQPQQQCQGGDAEQTAQYPEEVDVSIEARSKRRLRGAGACQQAEHQARDNDQGRRVAQLLQCRLQRRRDGQGLAAQDDTPFQVTARGPALLERLRLIDGETLCVFVEPYRLCEQPVIQGYGLGLPGVNSRFGIFHAALVNPNLNPSSLSAGCRTFACAPTGSCG